MNDKKIPNEIKAQQFDVSKNKRLGRVIIIGIIASFFILIIVGTLLGIFGATENIQNSNTSYTNDLEKRLENDSNASGNIQQNSHNMEPIIKDHKSLTSNNSGFGSMTKIEKSRITEIITGVINDTIPVTDVVKKEIQSIFTKYNITNDEIEWFKIYGPALMTNYEMFYYADAQQSLRTGVSFKSNSRLTLEDFAVSIGEMTPDDIKAGDLDMEKVAKKRPFITSDGSTVLTDELIIILFNKTKATLLKIDLLFEK